MTVQLPAYLSSFYQDAHRSLHKHLVKDIEFSRATYQVLVEDLHTHEDFWVFIQLEGKGQIKDAFCACEQAAQDVPCLHLAVAYLGIFGSYQQPLHQRFARSLWNHLCHLYLNHLGEDSQQLKKIHAGYYVAQNRSDRVIFSLKGLTPEGIQSIEELLERRPIETEETSLKFSNLSQEELVSWEEGNPSPELRYDISYWSDLAKWLLKLQESQQPYEIEFQYSQKGLPQWLAASFKDIMVGFYLPIDTLPSLIPTLNTVNIPFHIYYQPTQGISHLTYHKEEGRLYIEQETQDVEISNPLYDQKKGIAIDGWVFIPGKGFYATKPHPLSNKPYLEGEELSEALNEYSHLIAQLLVDIPIHRQVVPLRYYLSFDKSWNLHIHMYLFEVGDLSHFPSRLIGQWAYLEEEGFYRLQERRFDEIETIIPIYSVSDFVTQNRAWLNKQEGFQPHIKHLEYQLSYHLSDTNRLTFNRVLAKTETLLQDFGAWVYLDGHGFYPKGMSSFHFLLRPGLSLSAEQIPLFIRMNQEELALIPHFFHSECPITRAGLKIELMDKHRLKILPTYEFLPPYTQNQVRFFDDFVYTEQKGFSELPSSLRLPDKFLYPIEIKGEEVDLFLATELETLRPLLFYLDPHLEKPQEVQLVTSSITKAADKGRGWYQFVFYYRTERGLIAVTDIYEALNKKQSFAFFPAGLLEIADRRFDWLRRLPKERCNRTKGVITLSSLEFMRLYAFDPITFVEEAHEGKELLEELIHLRTPNEPNMTGLLSHLRSYQEIGVHWLWFLYSQGLSGLLCDDMGLGKTHQAMALIASIVNFYRTYAEGTRLQFLIVCPTSVIYHWQEKLASFLPHLHVYTFYGSQRRLENFQNDYDILLTSYGILRNEYQALKQLPFELAIFDEIQIAKNQTSRIYAALVRIQAHMKLGLTGTPIENHLRELKSLFDIVLPSYMPTETEYREFFIKPIEREHNPYRKDLLNRIIHPFILRRKKGDVLKELPEKTEEIAHCDLSLEQQRLYNEVLEQRRRHLIEELENEQTPIPYLHVFALLSNLKQICDHPAVYLKVPQDYKKYASGKWDLFLELLNEARESQQKVVVFSQYLGMLDIIESHLTEYQIGFSALRGSTQNRKEQLYTFNHDPACEVFVGSLQAAGLGVDLTAGSVVIHYDRWWNAARENQATDRVHRIGQKRGVQVFKLVTKNTFEEKIDLMIERKGQLMEDIVGVDDHQALKRFNREELIHLLATIEQTSSSPSDVEGY